LARVLIEAADALGVRTQRGTVVAAGVIADVDELDLLR